MRSRWAIDHEFPSQQVMLEILVIVIAMLVMARKGKPRRRRSMGRYIRGNIDEFNGLSTLGAKTIATVQFDEVVNERTLVSSIVATYSMTAFTKSTGDGPIMVGIAHGDYTATEIEEYLESVDSWDEGNLQEREVRGRKIRKIGIFLNPADEASVAVLNDGKPIKTRLNWILNQAQTLQLWAYNMGTSALATTSPIVSAQGHANLWPR